LAKRSLLDWGKPVSINAPQYNYRREEGTIEIHLGSGDPVVLEAGSRRGFYLSASENVISFGEGVYRVSNRHGVELYSSHAVSSFFGTGIDGFSLSCEVSYMMDDGTLPKLQRSKPLESVPIEDVPLPPITEPSSTATVEQGT